MAYHHRPTSLSFPTGHMVNYALIALLLLFVILANYYKVVIMPPATIKGLPAGQYVFRVGMYNLATGERLSATAAGGQQSDHILLGPVTVP